MPRNVSTLAFTGGDNPSAVRQPAPHPPQQSRIATGQAAYSTHCQPLKCGSFPTPCTPDHNAHPDAPHVGHLCCLRHCILRTLHPSRRRRDPSRCVVDVEHGRLLHDRAALDSMESEGTWDVAHPVLVDDLAAAAEWLRARGDVADNVGLIGFSEGSWIAPLAAARTDAVTFIVALSGGGLPKAESFLHRERMDPAVIRDRLRLDHEGPSAVALRLLHGELVNEAIDPESTYLSVSASCIR